MHHGNDGLCNCLEGLDYRYEDTVKRGDGGNFSCPPISSI